MCEEYQNSNIYIASNVLDTSLCDELVRIYQINKRNILDNCLYLNKINDRNTDFKVYTKLRELILKIFKANKYIKVNADEGYTIYNHMHETELKKELICNHAKYFNNLIKSLVIFINLNDNKQEANFEFPDQEVSIKIEKGSAVIFPPYWTHPYKITETTEKVLYLKVNLLEYCCP